MSKYDLIPREKECPHCGCRWQRYPVWGECGCQKHKLSEIDKDHLAQIREFKSKLYDLNKELEMEEDRKALWERRQPELELAKEQLKKKARRYFQQHYEHTEFKVRGDNN